MVATSKMIRAQSTNADRVRELLRTCLRKGEQQQVRLFSCMYLAGFGSEERAQASSELRRLLLQEMVQGAHPGCHCCEEVLLDCGAWDPELEGACIWWRRVLEAGTSQPGHVGAAYLLSPSGRVVDWKNAGRVLHTFATTRLSEAWVRSVEGQCVRLMAAL